jgi:hypothetical protein
MKIMAPYFFTLLYLTAMLRPVAPVLEYLINQEYIAEYLCINRDKPALQCNGKCYLMSMLEKQQKEKHPSVPAIVMDDYPIGFVRIGAWNTLIQSNLVKLPVVAYYNTYSFLYSASSFHPPAVLG